MLFSLHFFSIPSSIALVSNIFKLTWIESTKSKFLIWKKSKGLFKDNPNALIFPFFFLSLMVLTSLNFSKFFFQGYVTALNQDIPFPSRWGFSLVGELKNLV